jgi:hypothetical protein
MRSRFEKDRQSLMSDVTEYLNQEPQQLIAPEIHRNKALETARSGNLVEAIQNLEQARDAKKGILLVKLPARNGNTPVLIRDARNCFASGAQESFEAAEMMVLSTFQAAQDVIDCNNSVTNKGDLKRKTQEMAFNFLERFAKENDGRSAEELAKQSHVEISKIADFLQEYGVNNAEKKLTKATHFQNFKQKQNYNPVTISTISDKDNHSHTLIEAGIAYKGLTDEQKELYNKIIKNSSISKLQKSLMEKYREEIFSGDYVIPAQLINAVPGIKNAFEELTLLVKDVKSGILVTADNIEVIDVRKRAAALPTLLKDRELTAQIADANIEQAKILIGNGKKVHWNSLNTDIPMGSLFGGRKESEIVQHTRQASENSYSSFTATPFNRYRRIGVASDLGGIEDYLDKLSDSISSESKAGRTLKKHIKSKNGFLPLPNFTKAISEIEANPDNADLVTIAKLAKEVKKAAKQASAHFRFKDGFDEENISLQVSTKFSRLTRLVNEAVENGKLGICDPEKVPLEEVVTSCKSAKDRTGLNMFYRTAKVLEERLGVTFGEVCNKLHLAGHSEYLPGSAYVGGGTPGCYQLQNPVLSALPKSEREHLEVIVGPFATNNKGPKKPTLFKKATRLFSKKGQDGISDDSSIESDNSYEARSDASEENITPSVLETENIKITDRKNSPSMTAAQISSNRLMPDQKSGKSTEQGA